MNLLLLNPEEWKNPLPYDDPRSVHIRSILKSKVSDSLDAGIINGLMGKAVIREILPEGSYLFDFHGEREPPALCPLTLIIGIPRPPTAKRLLRDLTAAGVERIFFTATDLGEKSYLTSRLWSREEYKDAVLLGMAQGESTRMPEIEKFYSLYKCIDHLPDETDLLAMDNINPEFPLKTYLPRQKQCTLAIGPERGWSDREREIFKERGFTIGSLGNRVLRTETAAHMGCALVQASLGYI
ncbi:RsmE family RNA methyltransferase [Oceanispirochaeta sp.]|jgi:16S rRNA (uracil1498-N3)-methyltransferase|uniref:RsmE family RNA methyltransferase n=1 Tax=Oceanispirochaeta sp. TaxID=2035350 RepID=UPI002626CE3D|nr:RsmE family RNA methyltransferase [Oceanispirochaeta sp.]MDA3956965.1 RsmE family RNA methyltransferase [Oceanispirochaeta sp.]